MYSGPIVDCGVHQHLGSERELAEYLPASWRELVAANKLIPSARYQDPFGALAPKGYAGEGEPTVTRDALKARLLAEPRLERVVFLHSTVLPVTTLPNQYLATQLCIAANDWTVERWLDDDTGRFHGSILVPTQIPEEAVSEIQRLGSHPRMATVLLSGNGLHRPFGHPIYHPIYAAAAEAGLSITLHAGSDAGPDTSTAPTGGGEPMLFGEFRALAAQSLMTHLSSLLVQGVFEKFPSLRLLVFGGGVSWLPALMWRLDGVFGAFRREVPWLKRTPMEYLADHVHIATYPLERPARPEQLAGLLASYGGAERLLCFASGYPDRQADRAAAIAPSLPPGWQQAVFHDNAFALHGWS